MLLRPAPRLSKETTHAGWSGTDPTQASETGLQAKLRWDDLDRSAQGFDVLEGTMDGLVRIIDASAVLDGFQGRQQFRDGEKQLEAALELYERVLEVEPDHRGAFRGAREGLRALLALLRVDAPVTVVAR